MQGNVVEHSMDTGRFQIRQKLIAHGPVLNEQIKEVIIGHTMLGNHWQLHNAHLFKRDELASVILKDLSSACCNFVEQLELAVEKRTSNLTWDIRRTDIDPSIFIDLASKELLSIGALITNDFSLLEKAIRIDAKCSAFATDIVFCFVKTKCCEVPNRAESSFFVKCIDSLRCIFDDHKIMI